MKISPPLSNSRKARIIELKSLLKPIPASVSIPGSKSYTNRALFIAAMSGFKVKITNPLISDDTKAMIDCLKTLGVNILEEKNCIEVSGNLKKIPHRSYNLNANLSGTTLRFILALSTIIPGTKILSGKEGLNKRPIGDLVEGLRQLGAKIEYLYRKGYPPIKVLSSKLISGTIKIKGSISSQYISAILMVAPLVGEVNIEVLESQVSTPYIDMTIDTMEKFGVKVRNINFKKYNISSDQKYNAKQYLVEGDLSSASYFLAIAALTKSEITIENINPQSKQADMKFIKILENIGNKITFRENEVTITGAGVKPVNVNMQDCPDQIQTLSVLAAFANGISKIEGISSLRIKETDRVFALRQELKKMGIKTSVTKDELTIHGGNPNAATIETYGDHRMAMSFAIAGSKLSGMKISNPNVVSKTFPDFFEKLKSVGIKIDIVNSKNIVLIGMRGSGKTTIAKMLSKKLNKLYIDLDEMLAKKMKMSISQIVEKFGWEFFRDQESEIVKQVSNSQDVIISTGGGVVTRLDNIEALRKNGILIYLNTPLETLVKRVAGKIGENPKMPALTDKKDPKAEIAYVLSQREKLYKQAAHQILLIENLRPNEIADKIVSKFKEVS
ncbi:3-phosphoshikimate 1-carboxyvinyltransferase [Candidatus Daviesbacteria bacterium]|nr:3-phosphoshikimate 1-carboxyvinyltransferase [Candidatus Daviesbacteria bacterium]